MNRILLILITDLCITLLVEMIAARFQGVRSRMDHILILAINGITNPLLHVVFVILSHIRSDAWFLYGSLLILEILVIGIEAVFFRHNLETPVKALRFSLTLNMSSYIAGLLITFCLWGNV